MSSIHPSFFTSEHLLTRASAARAAVLITGLPNSGKSKFLQQLSRIAGDGCLYEFRYHRFTPGFTISSVVSALTRLFTLPNVGLSHGPTQISTVVVCLDDVDLLWNSNQSSEEGYVLEFANSAAIGMLAGCLDECYGNDIPNAKPYEDSLMCGHPVAAELPRPRKGCIVIGTACSASLRAMPSILRGRPRFAIKIDLPTMGRHICPLAASAATTHDQEPINSLKGCILPSHVRNLIALALFVTLRSTAQIQGRQTSLNAYPASQTTADPSWLASCVPTGALLRGCDRTGKSAALRALSMVCRSVQELWYACRVISKRYNGDALTLARALWSSEEASSVQEAVDPAVVELCRMVADVALLAPPDLRPASLTKIISRRVGDSAKAVGQLLHTASGTSCIVAMDDVDCLFLADDGSDVDAGAVTATLLTGISGVGGHLSPLATAALYGLDRAPRGLSHPPVQSLFVIATTSVVDRIPASLLRPGRLSMHLTLPQIPFYSTFIGVTNCVQTALQFFARPPQADSVSCGDDFACVANHLTSGSPMVCLRCALSLLCMARCAAARCQDCSPASASSSLFCTFYCVICRHWRGTCCVRSSCSIGDISAFVNECTLAACRKMLSGDSQKTLSNVHSFVSDAPASEMTTAWLSKDAIYEGLQTCMYQNA